MIDRRRLIVSVAGAAALPMLPGRRVAAQNGALEGRIAFIKDSDVWEWSSESGTNRLVEDGRAMDPTWDPTGRLLLYSRDGGSYSDLILANPKTGNLKRLTDNESSAEEGSPDYVNGSSWAFDACWSQAGIVCYVSDANSSFGEMMIWILNPEDGTSYEAATDGADQGPVEAVSVDASAAFCVYTVLSAGGEGGGTTYVAMRDLNMGTTYPLVEAAHGAYDASISPDADWIVASLRDELGISDLWIFNRLEETLQRLTKGEQASNATWSPDGKWIAYLRRAGSTFEIKALEINTRSGARIGDAKRLVEADGIDATSGLSWTEL